MGVFLSMAESTSLQFNSLENRNKAILQPEDKAQPEINERELSKNLAFPEKPEMNQKDKIWEFLEVKPPKRLELLGEVIEDKETKVDFFNQESLNQRISMKIPFWAIEKAVVIWNPERASEKGILTRSRILEEECRGHYPEKNVVPLIAVVKRIAQTGVILVDYDKEAEIDPNKGPQYTPEVKGERGTDRELDEYVKAPVDVIIEGRIFSIDAKGRKYDLDLKAYVVTDKGTRLMVSTRGMTYDAVPERVRRKIMKQQEEQKGIDKKIEEVAD